MKYEPDIVGAEVEGLTLAEEGAYHRCLRHIWRTGPMPEDKLRRMCSGHFDAVKERMEQLDGLWFFRWAEDLRKASAGVRDKLVKAGTISANKRSTDAEQMLNGRSTDVLSISNSPSSSTSLSESQEGKDAIFERLWIIYDRYGAKAKALAYWKKLPQEDRDAITAIAPEYVASTPGCEYRKQLEGWINPDNRLWERPIIQKKGSATARALHSADVSPDAYSTQ